MNQTIEYRDIHGNRNYKDSLFRMVFKMKRKAERKQLPVQLMSVYRKGFWWMF